MKKIKEFSLVLCCRTREVVFPRFKLEQSYDLIEHLKEMGLTDLFTDQGDFTPMTSEKVIINWVRQQSAVVELLQWAFHWMTAVCDALSLKG